MIPSDLIAEWRTHTRWATDEQVEQDLVLSRALASIFEDAGLARTLALSGGTAFHKLYFSPARRYSEDIDLVQLQRRKLEFDDAKGLVPSTRLAMRTGALLCPRCEREVGPHASAAALNAGIEIPARNFALSCLQSTGFSIAGAISQRCEARGSDQSLVRICSITVRSSAFCEVGSTMDRLRSRLDPWLGEPRREQGQGVWLIYRFESEIPACESRRPGQRL